MSSSQGYAVRNSVESFADDGFMTPTDLRSLIASMEDDLALPRTPFGHDFLRAPISANITQCKLLRRLALMDQKKDHVVDLPVKDGDVLVYTPCLRFFW